MNRPRPDTYRGVGKTHFALGVAYAVATGGRFLKWNASKPKRVLFIDGEMPGEDLRKRLEKIAENGNHPTPPFEIITPDLQENGMVNLTDPRDQELLSKYTVNADLIIVDNIATLCSNGRENESETWAPIQQWALRLRAQGKSVLFIHHAGKKGDQRGTSAREDVLDTVISLKEPSDYNPEEGTRFEVHFEKSRGFYGKDAKSFEAYQVTDEHGSMAWTIGSKNPSIFDSVLDLHGQGLEQKDIASQLKVNKSTVSRYVKRAKTEGLLEA